MLSPSSAASASTLTIAGSAAMRSTIAVVSSDGWRSAGTSRPRAASTTPAAASGPAARTAAASSTASAKTSSSGSTASTMVDRGRPRNGRKPAGRNITPSAQPTPSSVRVVIRVATPWMAAPSGANTTLTTGWARTRCG